MKLKNITFTAIKILFLNDVDIDNTLTSNKTSSGEKKYKYFVRYIDDYKSKPFTIILPKTSVFAKSYDGGNKYMYFLIQDGQLY